MSSTEIDAKIEKVALQVTGFDKESINIVLQSNNLDVNQTITDFIEGRASSILDQWKLGSNSTKSKKKAYKKKNKAAKNDDSKTSDKPALNGNSTDDRKLPINGNLDTEPLIDQRTASVALKHMLTANGNDTVPASLPSNPVYESFDKPTKTTAAKSAVEPKENPVSKGEKASQMRTTSQRGANSRSNKKNRKAHDDAGYSAKQDLGAGDYQMSKTMNITKNMEKSSRDLQRCTVSFARSKDLLVQEFDESYKKVKQVFEEMTEILMNREVSLLRMLDNRKEEAFSMLYKREARAKELKRQIERAASMNPKQVNELRLNVKSFVGDAKFEHELGRAVRFTYSRAFVDAFQNFGELASVKNLSIRPRERHESAASDISSVPSLSEPLPQNGLSQPPPPVPATSGVPQQEKLPALEVQTALPAGGNWADEVDVQPISTDNRASWAIDTPLATSSDKPEIEARSKKESPKPQRDRHRRRGERPSDKDPSNPNVDKPDAAQSQTPAKDANFRVSEKSETRSFRKQPRDFSRRYQPEPEAGKNGEAPHSPTTKYQNTPRGRGSYRGRGYRGSGFRGSYQNRYDQGPRDFKPQGSSNGDFPPKSNFRGQRQNRSQNHVNRERIQKREDQKDLSGESDAKEPIKQE